MFRDTDTAAQMRRLASNVPLRIACAARRYETQTAAPAATAPGRGGQLDLTLDDRPRDIGRAEQIFPSPSAKKRGSGLECKKKKRS